VSTLNRALARQEKEIIETALEECYGQVSGPSGAATNSGCPRERSIPKITNALATAHLPAGGCGYQYF
jgi:hypothetical protein